MREKYEFQKHFHTFAPLSSFVEIEFKLAT